MFVKDVPTEFLQYPFCEPCHQKIWKDTSPATNFIQTAQIRTINSEEEIPYKTPLPLQLAICIGDKNDPILDSI